MSKSKGQEEKEGPRYNRVISASMITKFIAAHPGAKQDREILMRWIHVVETSAWSKFADVRVTFGDADPVGKFVVFNVHGNKYRYVARVQYKPTKPAVVYLIHVLTHKEYDKLDLKAGG